MGLSVSAQVGAQIRQSVTEGTGSGIDQANTKEVVIFSEAAGALGVEAQWNDYRTLGGSADSLDVAGGVTNRLNETKTFIEIKVLDIKAASTNTGDITVGGGSNALLAALPVMKPGAHFTFTWKDATGLAVTAGTGDLIQVAGTSGDKYEILIAGEI